MQNVASGRDVGSFYQPNYSTQQDIVQMLPRHSFHFPKTADADKYNGFQYNLSANYYKLYLDHLSQTRKQLAAFHHYYNEQKKDLNDVIMIYNLSIQNKQSKVQVVQTNKNHRQIRKPDFSINFDKDTVLDLENDIEYQKLKQQRLKELKQQLQTEQRAKLQQYEDELQEMVKASNEIIQEAHAVINANEYVGSKRKAHKPIKNSQLAFDTQASPTVTLKQSGQEPPANNSSDSLTGTQKLEPTYIMQTKFKLKDLESMKTQFLIIHYHLLKMFDRQFKPYMTQFIQTRDLKLEDRVDNIMGRLSKDLEIHIVSSKLVVKSELIDGYSLTFEGNQPFEAIQTDEYQDFLNQSIKSRIACYESVFTTVNNLQEQDAQFKAQRATEIHEHMEELAVIKAPRTKFEPDQMLTSFFQNKCEQYENKLQQQRDQLQQYKRERQEQERQKLEKQQEKQHQLELQSQQKLQVLRDNKIQRMDAVNKKNNQIELQRVQGLEKERKQLLAQKEKLPAGRQQQQIINRVQKIDEQLSSYQRMRNGVKQLYQFNEEMGSLQKAINRFSTFISDPQNAD